MFTPPQPRDVVSTDNDTSAFGQGASSCVEPTVAAQGEHLQCADDKQVAIIC